MGDLNKLLIMVLDSLNWQMKSYFISDLYLTLSQTQHKRSLQHKFLLIKNCNQSPTSNIKEKTKLSTKSQKWNLLKGLNFVTTL